MTKPAIFEFLDAVHFLNAELQWRKSADPKFSIARWAEAIGLTNSVTLRFILKRRRGISSRTGQAIKSNLRLDEMESRYFDVLVAYSQAANSVEKSALGANLLKIQQAHFKQTVLPRDPATRHAFVPVILALMTFDDLEYNAKGIAHALMLDDKLVSGVLNDMVKDGLITLKGDVYKFDSSLFRIEDTPNLKDFYEYWIERSKSALNLPFELRRYRALKFALSSEEFNEVIEKINEFSLALLSKYHSPSIAGRRLYMYEGALFPISKLIEPGAGSQVKVGLKNN